MIHERLDVANARPPTDTTRDDRIIAATVILSAAYATLRYNVFKGVPWADWPHFIGNKILALASLVLIVMAVLRVASARPQPIHRLMAAGSAMALVHTFVSLGLFRPAYFDKFFVGDRLSPAAGISLLAAAVALALLSSGKGRPGSTDPARSAPPLAAIGFLSGLHAALPSIPSWFEPATWPGRLPPITLISFILGTIAAIAVSGIRLRLPRSRNPLTGNGRSASRCAP